MIKLSLTFVLLFNVGIVRVLKTLLRYDKH